MGNIKREQRKRGAQPGNLNALRHGFYSHQFRNGEIDDLENLLSQGLDNEITMLRIMIRRFFEMSADSDQAGDFAPILSILGTSSVRLANLMRSQKALVGGSDEVEIALKTALAEIKEEWNLR